MERRITRKDLWDAAGKAGLVLGLVSTAYLLLTQLPANAGHTGFLFTVLNLLLWAAKLVGCILLMKLFMTRFAGAHPEADNRDTFRFGMVTAFLSALIFAAFDLAYVTLIAPDTFSQAIETASEAYGSYMTSESLEALENINFGSVSFFINLIYCFIYGTVLSAILSRNIPSKNPFAGTSSQDNTPEQQ